MWLRAAGRRAGLQPWAGGQHSERVECARLHGQPVLLQLTGYDTHGSACHPCWRRRRVPVRRGGVRLTLRQWHVRSAECAELAAGAWQRRAFSGHLHLDGADRRERGGARRDYARGDGSLRGEEPERGCLVTGFWVFRSGDRAGAAAEWRGVLARRWSTRWDDDGGPGWAEAGVSRGRAGHGGERVP